MGSAESPEMESGVHQRIAKEVRVYMSCETVSIHVFIMHAHGNVPLWRISAVMAAVNESSVRSP